MRNLVIVMAGDASLHEAYAADRDFELWVCYWGSDAAVAARYRASCDRFFALKGQKWALVRDLGRLAREQDLPPFADYDYVFLPDDDIAFPGNAADIAKAFALAREIGADCFQPAIANANFSHSWEWTRAWPGQVCHAVNLVEIMMPAFSGVVFERCVLPLLHLLGYMTVGWGLEAMVVRLGEATFGRAMRAFVLDAVPAVHTRPIGGGSAARARGWDELFLTPQAYAHQMQEHARFASAAEAARFDFPTLDDTANRAGLRSHLLRIRVARLLTEFWRAKVIAIDTLNRLRKVDVRTKRR